VTFPLVESFTTFLLEKKINKKENVGSWVPQSILEMKNCGERFGAMSHHQTLGGLNKFLS